MPYKFETEKKLIPRNKKRNVKLTTEQREYIKANPEGLSKHQLAAKFNVSRRLIQFIMHPERQAKNLLDRQKRGGSKIYYDKEKHKEAMKDHRKYKKSLSDKNLLIKNSL